MNSQSLTEIIYLVSVHKEAQVWDFPDGPVIKNPPSSEVKISLCTQQEALVRQQRFSAATNFLNKLNLKMKLRLFMSHCRKNSVRDKVISKKWIYLFRDACSIDRMQSISKGKNGFRRNNSTDSVGHLRRREAPNYGVVSFYGLGNLIG